NRRCKRPAREPTRSGEALVSRPRRQHVTLLVGEHLLDGVRLLDVRDVPVPDAFPGRVRIAAEHQLAAWRVHLQQLRAVGVAPEGRMNDHAPPDLVAPVDDVRLSAENLAEDLVDGLGRISADGAARAPARIRVHPADVSTVERGWV